MKNLIILLTLMSLSIFATETKVKDAKKIVVEKTNILTKVKEIKKEEKKKEEKKEKKKEEIKKIDVKQSVLDEKKEEIKKIEVKKPEIKKPEIKKNINVNIKKPEIKKNINIKKPEIKKMVNIKKPEIKKIYVKALKEKKVVKIKEKKINPREAYKFGTSLNLGASSLLGLSLDYFITPCLNLELFGGFASGISLKYHFGGNTTKKFTFYMGGSYGLTYSTVMTPTKEFFYFPIGIQLIAKKGFSVALDMGLSVFKKSGYFLKEEKNNYRTDYKLLPMAGLKIGFRF